MLFDVEVKKSNLPELVDDKAELLCDIVNHRDDVEKVMGMVASHIEDVGEKHDYTKMEFFNDFAEDVLERIEVPNFEDRQWYNIHTKYERHHINSFVHDDVDLFDVLEMIVDCIVAGKSRNDDVKTDFLLLKDGILERAYWNTVSKICNHVKVKE